MRIKLLFVLLFVSALAFAQDYIDVVETTDGSVLKGVIIENKIDDYIRIELAGGSIFTVQYDEIEVLKKEKVAGAVAGGTNIVINNNSTATANANSSGGVEEVKSVLGYSSFELQRLLGKKSIKKMTATKLDVVKLDNTDLSEKISAYNRLKSDKKVGAMVLNWLLPGVGSFYQGDTSRGVTTLVTNGLLGVVYYMSYVAYLSSYNSYTGESDTTAAAIMVGSAITLGIYNIYQIFAPIGYEKRYNNALKKKLRYMN